MKFQFHKQRYGWEINKDIPAITPLSNYLKSIYPDVPLKSIVYFIKLRTRFRIKAINNKIAVIQRRRKIRQFVALAEEDDDNDDEGNDEENTDFVINELEAMYDGYGNVGIELEEEEELLDI
jgi:hypothetical protein